MEIIYLFIGYILRAGFIQSVIYKILKLVGVKEKLTLVKFILLVGVLSLLFDIWLLLGTTENTFLDLVAILIAQPLISLLIYRDRLKYRKSLGK